MIEIDLNGTVVVTFTCPACKGKGSSDLAYRAHCADCGRGYSREEQKAWNGNDPYLPCGHRWTKLSESDTCGDCDGAGRTSKEVRLTDLFTAFAGQEGVTAL